MKKAYQETVEELRIRLARAHNRAQRRRTERELRRVQRAQKAQIEGEDGGER